MEQIFIGKYKHTAVLTPYRVDSLEDFYNKFINEPVEGEKGGYYFTTASKIKLTKATDESKDGRDTDHYRRLIATHQSSWCVCIDGDQSVDNPESSISVDLVHEALVGLGINHVIYTTSSYVPEVKNKWRLVVPCELQGPLLKQKHIATVTKLYELLEENGCGNLKRANESFTLPQMWFLPAVSDPETSPYEKNKLFTGENFTSLEANDSNSKGSPTKSSPTGYSPETEIIGNIVAGTSPLHESINKYIYGNVQDGRMPEAIKATLHGLTAHWNTTDQKLAGYKADFDRLVDTAVNKFREKGNSHWEGEDDTKQEHTRVFTEYPDQGGMMEELVQCCMDWMIFPNRQIAVTAARTVISALGSRVYTLPSGKGIALTALVTGRSTIGKSNIKKFFIWLADNFQLANTSQEFLGAQYYTSVKNMVEDLNSKASLLSIRTESGQSDKSTAGDMSRVMAYELEFSTESGSKGYISSGAQNDKIGAMFSPAVTTIRESVAKIQSDADVLNQTTVSGVSGRRSLVLIDPIKGAKNKEPIEEVPQKVKKLILALYKTASQEARKNCHTPMNDDLWTVFSFKDIEYIRGLEDKWLHNENRAARLEDDFESTFWGRLYERVPAYAGILAIADNPVKPTISNTHLDIAESSLIAELNAHRGQEKGGHLDDPLSRVIKKIESLFIGDMKRHINYYKDRLKEVGKKELADGAMEWVPISKKYQRDIKGLQIRDKESMFRSLGSRLRAIDIEIMSKESTIEKYGHKRMTLRRI